MHRNRYPESNRPFRKKKISMPVRLASKLIRKTACQLDYDNLPPKVFVKFLRNIYDRADLRNSNDREAIIPVMASGHVKCMHNCDNVERILSEIHARMKDQVIFWTFREAVRYWLDRNARLK